MAGVRALPDLKTRLVVDTKGLATAKAEAEAFAGSGVSGFGKVEQASKTMGKEMSVSEGALKGLKTGVGGFASSLIGLPPQAAIAAAAVFGIVVAGKALLDTYNKSQAAQRELQNAYEDAGVDLGKYKGGIDSWLSSNRAYIKDQDEAVQGFAAFTREGLTQKQVMDDMNVALDLSAAKHIALSEAVHQVALAEQGNGKALKDLGINMKDFPALALSSEQAAAKQAKAQEAVAKAQEHLKEVLQKVGLSQQQANAAVNDATKAHNSQIAAQMKAIQSSAAYQAAEDAVAKAQQNLAFQQTRYGENSRQAQGAADALQRAHEHLAKLTDLSALSTQKATVAHGAHAASLSKAYAQSVEVQKAEEALAAAQLKSAAASDEQKERAKESAAVHDELHHKLDGARGTVDNMTQAQNKLSYAWHELAEKAGPPLQKIMAQLFTVGAQVLTVIADLAGPVIDIIGFFWKFHEIIFVLAGPAGWLLILIGHLQEVFNFFSWIGQAIRDVIGWLRNLASVPGLGGILGGLGGVLHAVSGRAAGGAMVPHKAYLVGEHGPELFSPATAGSMQSTESLRGGQVGAQGGGRTVIQPVALFAFSPGLQRQMDLELRERLRKLDKGYA